MINLKKLLLEDEIKLRQKNRLISSSKFIDQKLKLILSEDETGLGSMGEKVTSGIKGFTGKIVNAAKNYKPRQSLFKSFAELKSKYDKLSAVFMFWFVEALNTALTVNLKNKVNVKDPAGDSNDEELKKIFADAKEVIKKNIKAIIDKHVNDELVSQGEDTYDGFKGKTANATIHSIRGHEVYLKIRKINYLPQLESLLTQLIYDGNESVYAFIVNQNPNKKGGNTGNDQNADNTTGGSKATTKTKTITNTSSNTNTVKSNNPNNPNSPNYQNADNKTDGDNGQFRYPITENNVYNMIYTILAPHIKEAMQTLENTPEWKNFQSGDVDGESNKANPENSSQKLQNYTGSDLFKGGLDTMKKNNGIAGFTYYYAMLHALKKALEVDLKNKLQPDKDGLVSNTYDSKTYDSMFAKAAKDISNYTSNNLAVNLKAIYSQSEEDLSNQIQKIHSQNMLRNFLNNTVYNGNDSVYAVGLTDLKEENPAKEGVDINVGQNIESLVYTNLKGPINDNMRSMQSDQMWKQSPLPKVKLS